MALYMARLSVSPKTYAENRSRSGGRLSHFALRLR